jgi:6-phosphogluconolactonase
MVLTPMATVATVPAGHDAPNFPADVQVHPSGRFVYVSNRGHDSIAIFAIGDEPSELVPRGHASTGGAAPRSFALTAGGRLMLVANQDSDTIVAFAVDGETGALEPTGAVTDVRTPVCVLPLPA